jgi:hypothetical protein
VSPIDPDLGRDVSAAIERDAGAIIEMLRASIGPTAYGRTDADWREEWADESAI